MIRQHKPSTYRRPSLFVQTK